MTEWLNVKQAAMHLGVSKEKIYRLLKSKSIPCYRIGKLWKFSKNELDKAVKDGVFKNV